MPEPETSAAPSALLTELCLTFMVRQAWLTMRSAVDDALAEHGLSVAKYATMYVLDTNPGITVAELARVSASTRQTATELVGAMQQDGLVERRRHPRDARSQQVFLTGAGRERLRAAAPVVQAVEASMEGALTGSERLAAHRWLARISGTRPGPGA